MFGAILLILYTIHIVYIKKYNFLTIIITRRNGDKIKIKIINQFQQNNQTYNFEEHSKILNGNNEVQLINNFSPTTATNLKHTPMTSVYLERSFSTYINILTDRRTKITLEHMEQNMVINYFQKRKCSQLKNVINIIYLNKMYD